ncbi:MAG: hypothetical protein M1817_004740 [Caeruleum heppii]|nr:MAG: hypothetical protein M1817_004740 [Caeruleum heppii]
MSAMPFAQDYLQKWSSNLQSNISSSVSRLSIYDYIRLVIIIGGYCLLRPYLLKLGGHFQAKDHERDVDPNEISSGAAISPNSLRGQVEVPEDSDSDDDAGTTGANWGKTARRRQRAMIRSLLDAEEKRKAEEAEADSDKEIEEFLVKT